MKKLMFTMFALMGIMLFAASNPVLIYDYKVSIKRLDVSRQSTKINGNKVYFDSPCVVSDTLTGYVVIRSCDNCGGTMEDSTDSKNEAIVYIVKKNDKKCCYRAVGCLVANVFGKKSGSSCAAGTGIVINEDKLSDCSVALAYPLDWDQINGNGFFGMDNFQAFDYTGELDIDEFAKDSSNFCWNEGFGKVQRTTITTATPCIVTETSCFEITSVSGQTIANTCYTGKCTDFLFDLCGEHYPSCTAPVVGTFTIKLNKSMTFKNGSFRALSYADAEELIIDKAGYTQMYAPENDPAVEDFELMQAEYWTDDAE